MQIKAYTLPDLPCLLQLFYDTVRTVNARDYSERQLDAWTAHKSERAKRWAQSFALNDTLIAVDNGEIVGFGDIDRTGYLDHLFVHADHQGKGIATALCIALEEKAKARGIQTVSVHASITARPFFARRGYVVLREQRVLLDETELTNYLMEKRFK